MYSGSSVANTVGSGSVTIPVMKKTGYKPEFAAAVEEGASESELCTELGDVLLQVLFHAEIAARRGAFDFGDVATSFVRKMRSRAPYLFDGSTGVVSVERQDTLWARGKASEV